MKKRLSSSHPGTSHKDTIFRYSQFSEQTVSPWTGRRWTTGSTERILGTSHKDTIFRYSESSE
jgi:hypothetical protein